MSELEERIERIENQGISKTQAYIREKLLKNIDVPLDRPADVVVVTGCNALLQPVKLAQLAALLEKFKVNFTFLSFEHCCFTTIVRDAIYRGDASLPEREAQARVWNRRNCARARDLGAHTVMNLCPGCNTAYLHNASDIIRTIYYLNFFRELPWSGRLDLHIDLYEGCHKKHSFYPECQARVETTLNLLGRIRGLTYSSLPSSICCDKVPSQVLKRVNSPYLLAASSCCYTNLKNCNQDPGLKIFNFLELLTKALE